MNLGPQTWVPEQGGQGGPGTNIAISVNKSALSVQKSALSLSVQKVHLQSKKMPFQSKKCPFSPKNSPFSLLLSALLKTAPLPSDLPAPLYCMSKSIKDKYSNPGCRLCYSLLMILPRVNKMTEE